MPDPKTIRLTDFTQGIQTTDRLDYAPNAVRAGSNVDLGKKVRTRGGISAVDSAGLPANSEIMAIEQVYFPTNEKSFLVAQVKITEENVLPEGSQSGLNLFSMIDYIECEEISVCASSTYNDDSQIWIDNLVFSTDTNGEIFNVTFDGGTVDDTTGNFTPIVYAIVDGSYVPGGSYSDRYHDDGFLVNDNLTLDTTTGTSYRYTDGPTGWLDTFKQCEIITVSFSYKKLGSTYQSYANIISFVTTQLENVGFYCALTPGAENDSVSIWAPDTTQYDFTLPSAEIGEQVDVNVYVTASGCYAGTSTATSSVTYALYALPDTLPDTGA